jgi:opacity protein-like surface antigen
VKILIGALVVILSTVASVRAADHPFEVSGAYAYLNDHTVSQSVPRGWTGGIAAAVTSWLTIAGEVGDSYVPAAAATSSLNSLYSFLAGPRYAFHVHERVSAFGQFLVGDVHASPGVYSALATSNDLSYQPGGGVDIAVARHWATRFEGDYRAVRDAGTTFNQGRFTAAIVFRP